MSLLAPDAAAPRFVRALGALDAPVPPYSTATGVPCHTPEDIVAKLAVEFAESVVNAPVEGVVAPIVVWLIVEVEIATPPIVPPVMATALAF
jgi:hypothetical protein